MCNDSSQQVTWIQSVDKVNVYLTPNSSRVSFSNNGKQITFTNLYFSDQQYYACGVYTASKFIVINSYYLYVKGNVV